MAGVEHLRSLNSPIIDANLKVTAQISFERFQFPLSVWDTTTVVDHGCISYKRGEVNYFDLDAFNTDPT